MSAFFGSSAHPPASCLEVKVQSERDRREAGQCGPRLAPQPTPKVSEKEEDVAETESGRKSR